MFFENQNPSKRLKKYSFDFSSAEINRIRVFSETYKNSLESLRVNVGTVGAIDELNVLFEELTKLSKLKNLRISMNRDNSSLEINNSSVQHLRRIGENCPQISGLELQLNTNSSEVNQNIFNALNDFKNLRKLRITLSTSDKSRPFLLTSKMLNNLKNLSHLTINGSSDGSLLLNDEFFESIESYLPKLQHLSFESTDITERTVESISKLKDLKSVDIKSQSMEPISDLQVMEVIRNCPKLKYFNLNNRQMSVNLKGKELKKMRKNQRTGRQEESGRRKGWFYGKRYEL